MDLLAEPGNITSEGLPGRPYPRLPDEANPQAFGGQIGQGIEQAADVLQGVHDQVQAQARQTMVTDAHNQTQSLSLKLTTDPQNGAFAQAGKNAFGLDQKYLPQFDQGVQTIASGIPDAQARQLYLNQVAPQVRAHLSEQLDTHELTQHKAYQDQTTQSGIAIAGAQAAANFNHPDILAANRDHVNYLIDQMGQSQGWSPETLEANRSKALGEFHSNVIDSMIGQGQVKTAQTYLYQASASGDLAPEAAASLQRVIQTKQEHDLVMNDKIQRDASNAALKNGILLQQQGKLTPQYIEKYHNTLEPQAYEYLYGLAAGKEATTDPHTFAPLLTDAMSGKDVTQQAQDALYAGKLSLSDFKNVVEKSDQPRKGYVARGADYITTALKPNALANYNPDISRSLANAIDDWRQWTEDNPNATEDSARTTYRTLAEHYQAVSAEKATQFMSVPFYMVGDRNHLDVRATAAATKAAHATGGLTDAEFERQAELIVKWNALQNAQALPTK